MKISYSAPIGIQFSGEDAALYGKPVLIAASNLMATCTIFEDRDSQDKTDRLRKLIDQKVTAYLEKKSRPFIKKKWLFEQCLNTAFTEVSFEQTPSYICAITVATVAALLEFYTGEVYEKEEINKLAFQIEKEYFHFSLGFFTSCSCFGGIQYFRKEFEFLKSVSKLNFKLSKKIEEKLYIQYTEDLNFSPAKAVAEIKELYNTDPKRLDTLFSQMEKLTKRLVVSIAQENEGLFAKSLEEVQNLLPVKVGLSGGIKVVYSKKVLELFQFKLSEVGVRRS